MIIVKSQRHSVQWYAVIKPISRHDINRSLTNFVWQCDCEIIGTFCVIRLLHQASTRNTFCIQISAILGWLSKCYNIYNKGHQWQTDEWPLTHGNVRNYWYSEWYIPWTNTWPSTKFFPTKCGFRPVHILPSNSKYFLRLDAGVFHILRKWITLRSDALSNAGSVT